MVQCRILFQRLHRHHFHVSLGATVQYRVGVGVLRGPVSERHLTSSRGQRAWIGEAFLIRTGTSEWRDLRRLFSSDINSLAPSPSHLIPRTSRNHEGDTKDATPVTPVTATPPVAANPLHPTTSRRTKKSTNNRKVGHPDYDVEAMLAFGADKDDMRLQQPIKKKKKKSGTGEKIIPPIPSFEEARDQMDRRFAEIEKEHLGHKRGVSTVKFLVGKKGEKLHKTVTTKLANTILNDWIYTRHAMKHGYRHLNEMTRKVLSASLIRPGTTVKYDDRDARLSLKELFRYGKSDLLVKYHAMDRRRDLTVQQIHLNYANNDERRNTLTALGYSPDQIAHEDAILLTRALRRGLHPGPSSTGTLPEPPVDMNANDSTSTSTTVVHRIRNFAGREQMEAAGFTEDEIVKEETSRHRHNLLRDEHLKVARARYKTRQTATAKSVMTGSPVKAAPLNTNSSSSSDGSA